MKGALIAICFLVASQVALAQVNDDSNKSRKGCLQKHNGNTPYLITDYYFNYEKPVYTLVVGTRYSIGDINISPYEGNTNFRVQGWDSQRTFTITPSIRGMSIDRFGNIIGTPTTITREQTYRIRQSTVECGSFETTLLIAIVNAQPRDFKYPSQRYEFDVCHFIPRVVPDVGEKWSRQRETKYSTDRRLPDGLKINADTGVIFGMPSQKAAGTYTVTITAKNDVGSTSTQIIIVVSDAERPPRSIYYWHFPIMNITRGRLMYPWCPKHCGIVLEYTISPALPAGLQFGSEDGCITGTPKNVQFRKKYVVTAHNQHGHANTIVRLRVWEAPKYLLKRLGWAPQTL